MKQPRLYFDNAATSFPKPSSVLEAMNRYATEIGASGGRGAYAEALESRQILVDCREALRRLFNGERAEHFVFTLNCSDALNMAIKGMIDPNKKASEQHVICTAADHNSTLRPLTALRELGWVEVTHTPVDPETGRVDPRDIERVIRPTTKLIVVTHASNVTGTLQPIREIGRIARDRGVMFLVDAAQSAGHVEIDAQRDCIDLMAAPGHKGLMGATGTGFLYVKPGIETQLRSLRHGGTGSQSDNDRQPESMPDKFEAGSHNTIGIAGLLAGVNWVLERGIASIRAHELELIQTFFDGISDIEGLTYFGPRVANERVGVFSVRIDGFAPEELAKKLEGDFGLLTRAGIHCAPRMHGTLQTVAGGGTTRFSFGPFLTRENVEYAVAALKEIAERRERARDSSAVAWASRP